MKSRRNFLIEDEDEESSSKAKKVKKMLKYKKKDCLKIKKCQMMQSLC